MRNSRKSRINGIWKEAKLAHKKSTKENKVRHSQLIWSERHL